MSLPLTVILPAAALDPDAGHRVLAAPGGIGAALGVELRLGGCDRPRRLTVAPGAGQIFERRRISAMAIGLSGEFLRFIARDIERLGLLRLVRMLGPL